MRSEDFVLKVKELKPNESLLLTYSSEFVNETLKQFDIKKRDTVVEYGNELLDLLRGYDISNLVIGGIQFKEEVLEDEFYFYLGNDEADVIVLNKESGKVLILDHEDMTRVLCECAKDGSSYLDAIVEAKKFFLSCAFDEEFSCEQEDKCSMAFKCASLAGGKEYMTYFKGLLGCWS